ncbi:MAG: CARDB domain-containing protein [Candidatus Hydrothermarchaeales archaeon]
MNKSIFLLVIVVYFILPMVHAEVSQTPSIQSISFKDLDADGDPDLALLETSFYKTSDTILVFDEDDDMVESPDYRICCDFDSDVWVFDSGGDDSAELIIDFTSENLTLTALLYDDQTGDKKVSYTYDATSFKVTESTYWTLSVSAEDFWLTDGGDINFNIEIVGDDGDIDLKDTILSDRSNDGKADFMVTIYDVDKDFDPDIALRQLIGEGAGYAFISVDEKDLQLVRRDFLFWPYLLHPINVNWELARIDRIDYVIELREGREGMYFIKSPDRVLKDRVNKLSFENLAWYDLANTPEGPDLIVRLFTDSSETTARYTWIQDGLAYRIFSQKGNGVSNASVIEFPNFSVEGIPYDEAPYWIMGQDWDLLSFVSTEGRGFSTIEGVYETPGKSRFPGKIGWRKEVSAHPKAPKVYISAVDGKLHLKDAEEGVWVLEAEPTKGKRFEGYSDFTPEQLEANDIATFKKVEYRDFDDDAYMDYWVYFENDIPIRHLAYLHGFLIYSDKERTKILSIDINQSLFETSPPRNHNEWKELRDKLQETKRDVEPGDFKALFKWFSGRPITIENGFLVELYTTDEGFSFTLDCISVCELDSPVEIDYIRPLTRGRWLLSYDEGFYIKRLARPSAIKLVKPDLVLLDIIIGDARELEYTTIVASIHNLGLLDVDQVLVKFFDGDPSNGTEIGGYNVSVLGSGGTGSAFIRWLPRGTSHDISVVIDPYNAVSEADETNNVAYKAVHVAPIRQLSASERLSIGATKSTLISVFVILLTMIGLGLYISNSVLGE